MGDPRTANTTVTVDRKLLDNPDQAGLEEHLRDQLGIGSRSTDYHEDPDQIEMTFAVPGARTVVTMTPGEILILNRTWTRSGR